MNISDFISEIGKSGLSRANRYSIEMQLPDIVQYGVYDYRKMLLLCESVQIPGLNINTAQIRTFGEIREMPYEFNYDPVQFSFYVDGDMIIKGIFDEWIKSIQNNDTRTFNYYKDYISPIVSLYVEDLTDKRKYVVELYEVYPKSVSAVQMGYDQKDVMKMTVSFAYKYWKSRVLERVEPVSPPRLSVNQPQPETEDYLNTVTSYIDAMGNIAFNF
jgi:hypothetical protein